MSDDAADDREVFHIRLRLGDEAFAAAARVPCGPVRLSDLLPILQSFDNALVEIAATEVEKEGKRISCRAGCGACCRQLVPISEAEAWYLAELVAAMSSERREIIVKRFDEALHRLDETGILERISREGNSTDARVKRQLGIDYFKLGLPCPFLEDESCSIHPHRPLSCREYLVTTPAENCAIPKDIERVSLPAKLSSILYRMGDGRPGDAVRWVPLVLALQWVADHANEPQPQFSGGSLFGAILDRLKEQGTAQHLDADDADN